MSYNTPPPPPNMNSGYGSYGNPSGQPHPKATTILVLGILSLVCCGILGPVVWLMGNSAYVEVNSGMYSDDTSLKVGRILGIISTALLALGIFAWLFLMLIGSASVITS